jgi:hypothetical protein
MMGRIYKEVVRGIADQLWYSPLCIQQIEMHTKHQLQLKTMTNRR